MKKDKSFSITARTQSFGYAINGIITFFKQEHNAWLHGIATIMVMVLAFVFPVSNMEAVALAFAVGFVWTAEIFNTVIEKIMDFISVEKKPAIKYIKDLAAGAVLVAAITSLITGLIIFIPKIQIWLR